MEKATTKKRMQLCAVMPAKMYEALQQEAKKQMISMSGLTRQILADYFRSGGVK